MGSVPIFCVPIFSNQWSKRKEIIVIKNEYNDKFIKQKFFYDKNVNVIELYIGPFYKFIVVDNDEKFIFTFYRPKAWTLIFSTSVSCMVFVALSFVAFFFQDVSDFPFVLIISVIACLILLSSVKWFWMREEYYYSLIINTVLPENTSGE